MEPIALITNKLLYDRLVFDKRLDQVASLESISNIAQPTFPFTVNIICLISIASKLFSGA